MMKNDYNILFQGREKKSYFKNDKNRNLWIKLNAEHIRYSNKINNNINELDLGKISKPYSSLWVSNNQLIYDEYMRNAPRLSLEELSALSQDEILIISRQRNQDTIKEIFGKVGLEL